jgi:OmcA/MtrC family decaheme c-type cytochrome
MRSKLWYIVALMACALLPLAGCSGGASSVQPTAKGLKVTVGGVVAAKSAAKAVFLSATSAAAANNVFVYDAQSGSQLGSAAIDGSGSFSGLSFTLPAAKTVLVFKAIVAQGTFRSIVPVDLSNPPAAGVINGSQAISIAISQDSNNIATTVSAMLGLPGVLGDTGQTLASVSKTYTDVATQVLSNGGQVLAYSTSGLALTGSVTSASLLPARDASTMNTSDLNNIVLNSNIISAFIPGKNPIVNFTVTDKATGKGISGLRSFGLHVAKLMPELAGSNSYWVNYIDKGISLPAPLAFATTGSGTSLKAVTGCIIKPSADPGKTLNSDGSVLLQGYTVIDHGDGTYTAVFGSDITSNSNAPYDATAVTRIGVAVTSIAVPGVTATGPINPATGAVTTAFNAPNRTAAVYDFTPSTGLMLTDPTTGKQKFARDIVTTAACEQCHAKIALIGGHQAARPDVRICVMCHTATNTSGEGEMVTFIHRIHMGEELPVLPPAESVLNPTKPLAVTKTLVTYGEQTYPQDIRNCVMCHKGVDGANWNSKPSQKSCGSCHNDVNFATGVNHPGGVQTTDSSCTGCHAGAGITQNHLAVEAPDPNSPELGGTNTHTYAGYLPAAGAVIPGAATITWDVKSAAVDAVTRHPSITFRFIKNGAPVVFNTYAAGSVTEMMNGFVGSPSAYFAFALPQDGVTAPADYNATASAYIKNVWNGTITTSTLSAIDGNGYYTLTINNAIVPAAAKMFTGGIGYTYGSATTPLTEIDLAAYPYTAATNVGGLLTVVPNAWKVGTGFTGRRLIVSNDKCNACHAKLGIAPTFHSGQRNDAQTCSFCHTVNKINSGWSVNEKDLVHAIHASGKRVNKFSWEVAAGDTYWKVTYPGFLRDCEQCHLAGTYDFSAAASIAAVPNLLPSTVANGTTPASISSIITGDETVPGTYYSPFVAANTTYGNEFKYTGSTGATTQADTTTLINSPIAAACFSCHDTSDAKAHMVQNGGSIYEARSTALGKSETCLVCHGTAQNTLNTTVPTIKAVHRWW